MQSFQKDWQVESQGHIYEADFEELKQWIIEGGVLPSDRVKRGNLRWLAAEKVPELYNFFNSDDFYAAFQAEVAATAKSEPINENFQSQFAFDAATSASDEEAWENGEKVCFSHKESEAFFACDVCKRNYCKICPNSFGGSVKICPGCGGLCRDINEAADIHKSIGALNKPYLRIKENADNYERANQDGFQLLNLAQSVAAARNPFVLILATLIFISILGAALSVFFMRG